MKSLESISKFLSLVLRHQPELIRLDMDKNGWVDIDQLIQNANTFKQMDLNYEIIKEVVDTNEWNCF